MTDRFVGIGGNDGNSGLTWALRKLTLNGAEDTPVVAGDTVYVGPGTYRETLTVDVSGAGGTPITYIGDVTGENTDGVGGIVRVTGSDNDQTVTRTTCVNAPALRNYRTFRGFRFDMPSSACVNVVDGSNWIVEDCWLSTPNVGVYFLGANQADHIVRRCIGFMGSIGNYVVTIEHGATVDDTGSLVENIICYGGDGRGVGSKRVGGITVKNSTFLGGDRGIRVQTALTVGQTVTVNNCILEGITTAFSATVVGEIIENYNTLWDNGVDRANVAIGGNSIIFPVLLESPILLDGVIYPWQFGQLSEWSQLARITGTGTATDDLYGVVRPATAAKISWGAIQLREGQRETTTVRGGSTASMNLADAGDHQIFVPVDAVQMTISVYVYREANYAGTNPRMIIRQPGQADDVTTDVGAVSGWNLLTTILTPSADTDYVVVILRSLNTAVAGNYDVFFDDLQVT